MAANLYEPPAGHLFSKKESHVGGTCHTCRLHLNNEFWYEPGNIKVE